MKTKICNNPKCQKELPATTEFFHKEKNGLYGLKAQCKNCLNNKSKKWKQDNKDKQKLYQKEYYKNNQEKLVEHQRQWRKDNPDRVKQYSINRNRGKRLASKARRRANKLNQTPEYANFKLIKQIYEHCPEGYHVDHMIPLSKRGLHYESNLCYLPASVNVAKHNKSIEEFGVDIFNENVIYWQDLIGEN